MRQSHINLTYLLVFLIMLIASATVTVEAKKCKPSGNVKGKKPPKNECDQSNGADCCEEGVYYTTYECSPPVSEHSTVTLTINSLEKGGVGGAPSECNGHYHDDDTPVVALSTGWYNKGKRCHNHITIKGNGRSVKAMVVDEWDSTTGCGSDHSYQPPCPNNIVDASKAVWKALGIKESNEKWGWMNVTWSDA